MSIEEDRERISQACDKLTESQALVQQGIGGLEEVDSLYESQEEVKIDINVLAAFVAVRLEELHSDIVTLHRKTQEGLGISKAMNEKLTEVFDTFRKAFVNTTDASQVVQEIGFSHIVHPVLEQSSATTGLIREASSRAARYRTTLGVADAKADEMYHQSAKHIDRLNHIARGENWLDVKGQSEEDLLRSTPSAVIMQSHDYLASIDTSVTRLNNIRDNL